MSSLGQKKPHISLVFPPFCESALHGPHLAIPLLRGVLQEQGVSTTAHDLNIKTVHRVLDSDFLAKVVARLDESDYPPEDKPRMLEALNHIAHTDVDLFINSGSTPLKTVLRYAKSLVFPCPADLDECLRSEFRRPDFCSELYADYARAVVRDRPHAVCISVAFSDQLSEAIELARHIRSLSSTEVWLGGSQINLLQDSQVEGLCKSALFDRISVRNGEQTIIPMVADLASGCREKTLYRSGPMNIVEINRVPMPVFDDISAYFQPSYIPVLVTKGCYWGKCTFCDYPKLSDLGGKAYIARDPGLVLKEIEAAQSRFGMIRMALISDAIPPSWYKKLSELAISRKVQLNSWSYMMHSKALSKELLGLMANAGVRAINFGTESLVDRILGVMKKQAPYEVIKANLEAASELGMRVVANAIPDYPTTTRLEAYENIRRFSEVSPHVSSLNPQMFDLTSGTPIDAEPELFQLSVPKNAYVKTTHGYHSREFSREDQLRESDRRTIERAFARLKSNVLVRERMRHIPQVPKPDTLLEIDGSIIFLSGTSPVVWIISLGISWSASKAEEPAWRRVLNPPGRVIAFQELRDISSDVFGPGLSEKWIEAFLKSGAVLGEERGGVKDVIKESIYGL